MLKIINFVILFSAFAILAQSQSCNIRSYPGGTVCVCNSTYCDTVPSLNVVPGKYQVYSTSKSKLGFYSKIDSFVSNAAVQTSRINVNPSIRFQTIIGFGGAFTDATGININSLPAAAQDKLLETYFSDSGIGYNLCRVPMAGTDFSVRAYSYDDVPHDVGLLFFTLQPEDLLYKIPYIQKANKLRKNNLKLYSSPWTAPPWMKTNGNWSGIGVLKTEYYQVWANYFVKFFDAYALHNILFWGLTTQNEPSDGFYPPNESDYINAMGWTADTFNVWIPGNLGPTIRRSPHRNIKILIHDDQRDLLPTLAPMLNNSRTMEYADGVAVHWYTDTTTAPGNLTAVKSVYKDLFLLSTEACAGFEHLIGIGPAVLKGSWDRGVSYIVDIIQDLQYDVTGWVDWNMALDETGGPNYINNFVDSPILVNATLKEFYKQPMYYALGHFSKFVVPGSVRLKTTLGPAVNSTAVQAVAFLRPDKLIALVIFNNGTSNASIQINDSYNRRAQIAVEANSINTILYN